jgi:hypothetical protein
MLSWVGVKKQKSEDRSHPCGTRTSGSALLISTGQGINAFYVSQVKFSCQYSAFSCRTGSRPGAMMPRRSSSEPSRR